MPVSQSNSPLAINTPLGTDKVLIVSATITEHLGRLFSMELDLSSEDPALDFSTIVGANATIRLELDNSATRYWNGYVSRFCQTEADSKAGGRYRTTLVPWLWFLTRTADCRIFQNQTVPDIIKKVFRDHGFTEFKDSLSGHYTPWENCVQYRETDFNFVSRLMEHEGIYYFFTHENGKHTLVLADNISAHTPFPNYDTINFRTGRGGAATNEAITNWKVEQEVQPGVYSLNDFNFEKPKTSLVTKSQITSTHAKSSFEIYDYPGEYEEHGDGTDYTRIRIEELHSQHEIVQGMANARGIATGSIFTLANSPRRDQNRKYLIISADYHLTGQHYGSGGDNGSELYSCSFAAIDSTKHFRAARITPKPLIQGPQTAIVVGPAGEEIYTDPYARVRVQFPWDRHGKADQNSSCWIRVSQPGTAGKGWGSFNIPRIGHEVIVEFLEGDPDLPIITGHVYNAYTMPKLALPAAKTQNGMISRSTPGGSADNFNELRFDDKKGQEHVNLQAEKDMTSLIKHDDTQTVNNDRTVTVKHDLAYTIENNETRTVTKEQALTIKEGSQTETIEKGDQKLTITTGSQTVEISAGTQTINVKGAIHVKSPTSITLEVGGSQIVIAPASITLKSAKIDLNP